MLSRVRRADADRCGNSALSGNSAGMIKTPTQWKVSLVLPVSKLTLIGNSRSYTEFGEGVGDTG